jgi:hypothetical protein
MSVRRMFCFFLCVCVCVEAWRQDGAVGSKERDAGFALSSLSLSRHSSSTSHLRPVEPHVHHPLGRLGDAVVGHQRDAHAVGVERHRRHDVRDRRPHGLLDARERHDVGPAKQAQLEVDVRDLEQGDRDAADAGDGVDQRGEGHAREHLELHVRDAHGDDDRERADFQVDAQVERHVAAPDQGRLEDARVLGRLVHLHPAHAHGVVAEVQLLAAPLPKGVVVLGVEQRVAAQRDVLQHALERGDLAELGLHDGLGHLDDLLEDRRGELGPHQAQHARHHDPPVVVGLRRPRGRERQERAHGGVDGRDGRGADVFVGVGGGGEELEGAGAVLGEDGVADLFWWVFFVLVVWFAGAGGGGGGDGGGRQGATAAASASARGGGRGQGVVRRWSGRFRRRAS